MAIATTSRAFLELVRRSGVVDGSVLDRYLRDTDSLEKPKETARRLLADGVLTSFQYKHLLAGRHRGLVLGQYRLRDHIGKGGNSMVFLAEHKHMRRRVAIKVLPAHRSHDRESLERFYREARAVATLDHPNIIRAHDVGEQHGVHYLVMEYAEGCSLQAYVDQRGALPHPEATAYVAQALSGLAHAHERGLIHRDIKPANLLLDLTGTIRILDMGLALFFDEGEDALTRQLSRGAVLGTADYISPEQALNCHEVDWRTDIYSLGATFYTLLNGQPPFHSSNHLTQKIIDHQIKEPPPIHALQPNVPPELSAIVARMMAKKPEDRFATAASALSALSFWPQETHPQPALATAETTPDMRLPAPQTPRVGIRAGI